MCVDPVFVLLIGPTNIAARLVVTVAKRGHPSLPARADESHKSDHVHKKGCIRAASVSSNFSDQARNSRPVFQTAKHPSTGA